MVSFFLVILLFFLFYCFFVWGVVLVCFFGSPSVKYGIKNCVLLLFVLFGVLFNFWRVSLFLVGFMEKRGLTTVLSVYNF